MEKAFVFAVLAVYILQLADASRIKIVNNGYEDILIALDPKTAPSDRTAVIIHLQNLLQSSSSILETSTKGKAHFRSVTFLVPRSWGDIKKWNPGVDNTTSFKDAGAALNRGDADVVVASSGTNDFPYTLHQGGCGRHALRIYLPSSLLLSSGHQLSGRDFVRLWSEFRYGVFPEGGFLEDEKYPATYKTPDEDAEHTTGCKTEPKRPENNCDDDEFCEKECKEECKVECEIKCKEKCKEKCKKEPIVSSLMDQYLPSKAIFFCEGRLSLGPNHNPVSPSKHNLLCSEEGTWFTVLRSPDFKYGRNAAPKRSSDSGVIFRYARETEAPRVIVAIDVSSNMKEKDRYVFMKNAFYHFVTTILPSGSELSLITFGGDGNSSLITSSVKVTDDQSRINYLEGQPLPEEPLEEEYSCLDCVLEDIVELVADENSSFTSAPIVILLTTTHYLSPDKYDGIQLALRQSDIRLHALSFMDDLQQESPLYSLCLETGNKLVYVERDPLKNLYGGFGEAINGLNTSRLIVQEYLITLDEEDIWFKFFLDKSFSKELKVSISGPEFNLSPLLYGSTRLTDPTGQEIYLRKREMVPSWDFYLSNPKTGTYTLKTRRKLGGIHPVMVSVYGTPVEEEEPITARVWIETDETTFTPPPVQIFVEVRKGIHPIRNATVIAFVYHPQNGEISEVTLLDDGLGNVDITRDDGIYSHYFVNFTSTGFYNVYVKVTGGLNGFSTVSKGPSSDCCGSMFPSNDQSPTGEFHREIGPVTFKVTINSGTEDPYPPAKVTDLRIAKTYDQMVSLQWTAVGNDFDAGVASAYELKLFRNRSLIRNRFSNPGVELYSQRIKTTPLAEYGIKLHHLMDVPKLERGVYYLGIRAVDDAGNLGEPSNAVALWVDGNRSVINCSDDQPITDRLTLTASHVYLSNVIFFITLFIIFSDVV